jgi:FG-GAP-like repeat
MMERKGVAGFTLLAAAAAVFAAACGGRLAPLVVDASTDARADAPDDAAPDVAPDVGPVDARSDGGTAGPTDAPPDVPPPDSGTDSGDACVPSDVGAPTPIAPLSTATVTSRQPTLHWQLAPASDGAQVEICHDRACTQTVVTFLAPGTTGQPPMPLAAGVYFWRLHGTSNGCVGVASSPTWEVFVGALSAPVDTSWGSVPDVDGDGVADAVTGLPGTGDAGGAVYVYKGGPQQLAPVTTITPPAGEWSPPDFGRTVAGAGDIDGDGFPEVLVSSNYDVWMFHGGAGGLSTEATLVVPPLSQMPDEWRAYGLAGVGDVDGDGYGDVAVGTINNVMIGGIVTIYRGGPAGLTASPTQLEIGDWTFGNTLAATDVNGDGYADILASGTQGVYVFMGGPGGPQNTPVLIPVLQPQEQGSFVASAGDMNGDGYGDILAVEQPYSSSVYPGALLYYGSAAGPGTQPVVTNTLLGNGGGAGTVAGVGDVNGDGYADFVLTGYYGESAVYLALGGVKGPVLVSQSWTLPMIANGAWVTLVGAGDVNGDGLDDLLVGAWGASASVVYLGDKTNGFQAMLAQTLPGGYSPL